MPGQAITRTAVPTNPRQMLEELWEVVNELVDTVASMKTLFDAHTHNGDGAQAGSYFTSPPRSDAATVTAGTASAFPAAPTKMSH